MKVNQIPILDNEDYIDDSIQKLEKLAENIIEQKNKYVLPYDFIEKVILIYTKNNNYREKEKILKIKTFKKWEIIYFVLDFFKSIDFEIYKKIKDIIFSKNPKIKLNIYKLSGEEEFNERDFEFEDFKRYDREACNQRWGNRDIVYIPFKNGREEQNVLKDDEGQVDDIYSLVHELTHTLDIYLGYILKKDEMEILSSDLYSTKNILTESIAIGMERCLTNYLLDNKICNVFNVHESFRKRLNNTINTCDDTCSRLLLARKKQEKEKITKEDIDEIAKILGYGKLGKKQLINILIKSGHKDFFVDMGYAFSGALAPTIQKLIKQGEIDKVKKCIKESRIGNFEKALEALEITLDDEGIKKLEKNMIEQKFEFEKQPYEEEISLLF